MRCGRRLLTTTAPVSASTIATSSLPLNRAAAVRKLSIVSSKWTIPATAPDGPGIGVVVPITHSPVSGET